jgi:hypothetical protein
MEEKRRALTFCDSNNDTVWNGNEYDLDWAILYFQNKQKTFYFNDPDSQKYGDFYNAAIGAITRKKQGLEPTQQQKEIISGFKP